MATLATTTSDGTLSFTRYVSENPNYASIEYSVERGLSTFLYRYVNSKLIKGSEYSPGTVLYIVDSNFHTLNGTRYAKCLINNELGFIPLTRIRKPTNKGNGTQYEDMVITMFNEYIDGNSIDIRLKGDSKIYKGISAAVKVNSDIRNTSVNEGDSKADFILCRSIDDPLAEGSIYVSHKKSGGPDAFQQYGGISQKAGNIIYGNMVVQRFLSEVTSRSLSDGLPAPVLATYDDPLLTSQSIFGVMFGHEFSIDNCTLIGQGKPTFSRVGDYVEVDFPDHMVLSGAVDKLIGDYQPVLGATFRAGRKVVFNGISYYGIRAGIYPRKVMRQRQNLIQIAL